MSTDHPEHEPLQTEYELVLEQLLCGDLDPDSPAAQELFTVHPHLRDDMLALNSTELVISKLVSDATTVVEEAQQGITDRDRMLVRKSIAGDDSKHRGRWALLVGGLAAAALALVLAGPGTWTQAPGPTGRLSKEPIPSGKVLGSYAPFQVFEKLKAGQKMRFEVFDMDGTELARSDEDATVWMPPAELAEIIERQPSIIWKYSAIDGSDSSGISGTRMASKVD